MMDQLVTFGMIVFMAAILFPVFARARENARRANCQQELKQICAAALSYSRSHGGTLPDIGSPQAIQTLVGKVPQESLICPSVKAAYKGNAALSLGTMKNIADPVNTVLFYESDKAHFEGCNVAFADGHVKWYRDEKWQEMKVKAHLP